MPCRGVRENLIRADAYIAPRPLQGARESGRGRTPPLRMGCKGCGEESPSHGFAVPAPFRQRGRGGGENGCPCCGAQNFCAALRRTLEILTAATRSPRFLCHRQRSVRSPHRPASVTRGAADALPGVRCKQGVGNSGFFVANFGFLLHLSLRILCFLI